MPEDHVISAADGEIGRFYKSDKGHQVLFESVPFAKRQISDVEPGESRTVLEHNVVKEKLPESHLRAKNHVSQAANG